jgi:hypothetical protein
MPQGVPASAWPVGMHPITPAMQVVTPSVQAAAVQGAPTVHTAQPPSPSQLPPGHCVPAGALTPSKQRGLPLAQSR